MAVYTQLGAEALAQIIDAFDVGALVSAKGIAEGVSNSNWMIETAGAAGGATRFILTMYEQRVDIGDLPFFLGLLDHLAARGCPVPRTIHDRGGAAYRIHDGKALALIEFLPGVSVDRPTAHQARAVGAALAQMHVAAAGFTGYPHQQPWPGWLAGAGEMIALLPGWPGIAPGLDRLGRAGAGADHAALAGGVAALGDPCRSVP